MKTMVNETFDMERALYGSQGIALKNCSFDGPADWESALKESGDIQVQDCFFNLRYPFWHAKNVVVRNSTIKGEYLAWYSENVTSENCRIMGTQPCATAKT